MEFTAEQQQYQQQYQYQQQAYDYDPSRYDHQSAASYYAYANQQQQQQQQYPYYPPQDSYSQQYSQFYQEAAPIHPPGVPLDNPAHHNQPTVYFQPQPAVETQQHQVIPVSGSDSAAATANFVGNINVVQRDNPPPQIQTAYRGGRRGSRPFRGGSRGHVGNRGFRPDGPAPPRNRGRGHSGNRHFASTGVTSAIPNSVWDPSGAAAVMLPSASVPGQATLPAQVPAAPLWPPPRMAWCELCRVDCNRPEILEQHKNGKRHKKNLQEQQKLNKVITGQQSVQMPNTGPEVVQFKKVEGSEEKQHQQEALLPLATTNDNKKETEQQKDIVNKSEASTTYPAETNRKLKGPSEARGRGFKRKMRGGRGGKYMKSNDRCRRPVEPPKPKGGIPFMCELCNVKCESQVVFDSHLAGKKHVANLKRFQGHRALYGEAGLQALYPPNFNAPSPSFIPQIQQDLTDPQVVLAQLLTYVLSQAQVPGLAAPQVSLPAATLAPARTPLSSLETQYPHQFTRGSLVTSEMMREVSLKAEAETSQHSSAAKYEASPFAGNNKAENQTSESEKNEVSQQQSFTAKFEVAPTAGTDVKVENGALVLENKPVISPMDNPICATSEYLATGGKPLLSSTSEKDTKTECKTVSLDPVDESGSNNNLEEPEEDPQEDVENDPKEQNE